MNAVERGLADAEQERVPFFEADIGGAVDEVRSEAVGNGGERSHGTGQDDHGACGVTATGDIGADVGLGMLLDFGRWRADELFCQVIAGADL